mgnify:CR=1 FL=1
MLKVRSEKLLIIAAAVWLLAGINILRLGIIAILDTELVAALLAIGIVVTFLLFHMMFAKLVGKQYLRVRVLRCERLCDDGDHDGWRYRAARIRHHP